MSSPYREIPDMPSDFGSIGRRLDVLVDFTFNVDEGRFYGTQQEGRDVYSGYSLSETTDFLILGSFPDGSKIQKVMYKDEGENRRIVVTPLAYRQLLVKKSRILTVETHFNDEQHLLQLMPRIDHSDLKEKTIDILLDFPTFSQNQKGVQGNPLRHCSNNFDELAVANGTCIEVARRSLVINEPHGRYNSISNKIGTNRTGFYKSSSISLDHILAIGVLE